MVCATFVVVVEGGEVVVTIFPLVVGGEDGGEVVVVIFAEVVEGGDGGGVVVVIFAEVVEGGIEAGVVVTADFTVVVTIGCRVVVPEGGLVRLFGGGGPLVELDANNVTLVAV